MICGCKGSDTLANLTCLSLVVCDQMLYLGTLIQHQMILITYQGEGCIFLIQTIQAKNDVVRIL